MQRVVDIKDIFYIEKRRNYSYIYLKDRRCVKVRKNLRDYEFELAGKGLVRVHAGYMVAMKYWCQIEKGQIVMEDGTEIPISRDRKEYGKRAVYDKQKKIKPSAFLMRISTYIDICQYIVRIYQRVAFVENNFLFLTKGDKKMETDRKPGNHGVQGWKKPRRESKLDNSEISTSYM